MAISRRDFLKSAAVTGALAASLHDLSWIHAAPPEEKRGWVSEGRIPSVCTLCPGGCGIIARTFKKRVVRIFGNPFHPVNAGGLCPRGVAGTQYLYNPDRIRGPMRRRDRSGTWEAISWEEAQKIVSQRLAESRGKGLAPGVVGISHYRGTMKDLARRFFRAYGSPNFIDLDDQTGVDPAISLMHGTNVLPVHNIEKSALVLSINGDFLDNAREPAQMMRAYAVMRGKDQKRRGKLIHAGPRLSATAAKADEWIPLNAGTEGAFALGIAHMLLKERLYDEQFVGAMTRGFADWTDQAGKTRDGLRALILKEYSPAAVSRITGVAVETVIRVAREFTRMKPSVAIGSDPLSFNRQHCFTGMAIHALNVLAGSVDTEGGVLFARSLPGRREDPPIDETARKGLETAGIAATVAQKHPLRRDIANFIPQALAGGIPAKDRTVLLFDANPVYRNMFSDEYRGMLSEAGFVVSFSSFFDETTQCADIVLPNHLYLERWGDAPTHTTSGFPVLGLQQPTTEPFYNTRHAGDVLIGIAGAIGESVRKAVWENDYLDFLKARFREVFEAPRGDIFGSPHEAAWTRLLERSGWKASSYDSFEDFWKAATEKGGWWEPIYYHGEWNRIVKTASRKIDFAPETLIAAGAASPLPHYEPIAFKSGATEFPLVLTLYAPLAYFEAFDSNTPGVQGISGSHLNQAWDTWVEIHPETAKRLGVRNNDRVIVESSRARISAIAKIFQGTIPDTVNMPVGLGRQAAGRWQKDIGSNPLEIVEKTIDPIGGEALWNATRVKLFKM